MTGPATPAGSEPENPQAQARRLQEELEAARRAGSAPPYETLAALAAGLGDVRGKVRYLDAVVDRAGLALAKDIRGRVGRLTAELDALGARVQDTEDRLAELTESGSRVPAPNWSAMNEPERAAQLAALSQWVAHVLVPVYRPDPALAACWRAHWPAIWELGVLWAEWRRVYGRKAPELAGALELAGRWHPAPSTAYAGNWPNVPAASASRPCRPASIPHREPPPRAHWTPAPNLGPGVLPCPGLLTEQGFTLNA